MPTAVRDEEALALAVGAAAHQALLKEVELTPKPGLVDRANRGAHRDMDLHTFHASAAALEPWFPAFVRLGASGRALPPRAFLARLRPEGMACEAAIFAATGGVNTHKGSIFSLGLLCAAAGRLGRAETGALCREVARLCAGLVEEELTREAPVRTAGERIFRQHGLPGVRGEAASGFATVRAHALPAFRTRLEEGATEELALTQALLHLLAVNPDTNLVARGGLEGLAHVQARASALLHAGGIRLPDLHARLEAFDRDLIARNLSPGGSADLLAVTWFLSRFPDEASRT